MDKNKYSKYVNTDCWRLRRDNFIRRFTLCELCGHSPSSQVHHLTYERLGKELDSDLVASCEGCHRAMHGLNNGTPRTWIRQYVDGALSIAESSKTPFAAKYREILQALDRLEERVA